MYLCTPSRGLQIHYFCSIISREKIQNSAKQFKPCNKRRIDSLVFEEDMIKALPNKLTKMVPISFLRELCND